MSEHPFLFDSGVWKGEGVISFSMAEDELPFQSRWVVHQKAEDAITFSQQIDVPESADKMENHFSITEIKRDSFVIELENQLVGKVHGKGVVEPNLIAWEFRGTDQGCEGFEIYEKTSESCYEMRAEFTAGEGLRTFVKGTLHRYG